MNLLPGGFARGFTLRLPLASLTESRFRSPHFFFSALAGSLFAGYWRRGLETDVKDHGSSTRKNGCNIDIRCAVNKLIFSLKKFKTCEIYSARTKVWG